jgi:DivIVA domain-containing protein
VVLAIEILVVASIVFVVAALAVGWFDRMAPAPPDASPTGLPAEGQVSARQVRGVRLNLAFRGYRMAEVDTLLARLAGELAWRDEELARRDDELVRLATFAHVQPPLTAPQATTMPQATTLQGTTPQTTVGEASDAPAASPSDGQPPWTGTEETAWPAPGTQGPWSDASANAQPQPWPAADAQPPPWSETDAQPSWPDRGGYHTP